MNLSARISAAVLSVLLTCVGHFARAESTFKIDQPYFFEISKNGKKSWILGTIHLGVGINEVADFIDQPVLDSRIMFFEILTPQERIGLFYTDPIQAIMTSTAYDNTDGAPISDLARETLANQFGIPYELSNHLRTFDCEKVDDYLIYQMKPPMMDYQLLTRARELNKDLRALDTPELLLKANAADRASEARTKKNKCSLEDTGFFPLIGNKVMFFEDVEQYRMGFGKPGERLPEDDGAFLRNKAWMKDLIPELNRGGIFINVGSGHLYGKEGLLKLFVKAGFSVKRIVRPRVLKVSTPQ